MTDFQEFDKVKGEVKSIICKLTAVPENELADSDSLGELFAMDSLNLSLLIVELESKFHMPFPHNIIAGSTSIKTIAHFIHGRNVQDN